MPPWRETALRQFPELTPKIEQSNNPYALWAELLEAFHSAYDSSPRDESLIARIYQYSDWCFQAERGETAADDLTTCVLVCFYEHIPINFAAREDMPRWFPYQDFVDGEHFFRYYLTEQEFLQLKDHFYRNRSKCPNKWTPLM